ncbi:Mut7-C RNAse domain-containing protein [Candidatus Latescibacterota bacterium]
MSKRATFRFYEELNDFLPSEKKKQPFPYNFEGKPSVKDTVEAIGVPHSEIDLILANGLSVTFSYYLRDGDMISVYPIFESMDISDVTHLRETPLRNPKFILDVHLGKLAKYLRMLGFDTLYENDYEDAEIVSISLKQHCAIITRDKSLLKRKSVTHGYWIRSQSPKQQLVEVIQRFDLRSQIKPFSRCTVCNGIVKSIPKDEVIDKLKPKTKLYFEVFFQCESCGRIYWKGSHFDKMNIFINRLIKQISETV